VRGGPTLFAQRPHVKRNSGDSLGMSKPHDRTNDAISLDEGACPVLPGIERILIFGVGPCVGAFRRPAFAIWYLEFQVRKYIVMVPHSRK
jgi:hypothetical protein